MVQEPQFWHRNRDTRYSYQIWDRSRTNTRKFLMIITSVGKKVSIQRLRFFLPQRLLRVRVFLIQLLW